MFGLGTSEILLVLLLGVVLFGGKKLPELGSALGKAIVNFKKGLNGVDEQNDQLTQDKTKDKQNLTSKVDQNDRDPHS